MYETPPRTVTGRYNQFTVSPGVTPDYYRVLTPPGAQSSNQPMSISATPMATPRVGPPAVIRQQPAVAHDAAPMEGAVCASPQLPDATNVKVPPAWQYLADIMMNPDMDAEVREQSQTAVEESLVSQGSCSGLNPSIVDNLRTRIYDLNARELGRLLSSIDTLNSGIHNDLACIVSAIVYPGTLSGTSPLMRERIREWFVAVRQIGATSVEGYVMGASFSPDTNLFVVKVPRDTAEDHLVHEAAIGILALNKLRAWVPNFMYVYGYAQCSPAVLENKELVTWCSSNTPAVSSLISENIINAMPLGDFVKHATVTEQNLLAVYLQLFNALNVANKAYGYTHYDLHAGNVMVRDFGKLVAVPYYATNAVTEGPVGYIISQYIPYIIDYGYNRIQIDGIYLGKIGLESAGVDPSRSFPMYDVYKNLCFTAEKLFMSTDFKPLDANGGWKHSLLETLFSFFQEEPILKRVERRLASFTGPGGKPRNSRDFYGASVRFDHVTMDDYLVWLHSGQLALPIYTDADLADMNIPIPTYDQPIDVCRFYESIDGNTPPSSALEYCETINAIQATTTLSDSEKQASLAHINSIFNAESNYLATAPAMSLLFEEFYSWLDANRYSAADPNLITHFARSQPPADDLAWPPLTTVYRDRIIMMLHLKEINAKAIAMLRAYQCALGAQGVLAKFAAELAESEALADAGQRFIDSQRKLLQDNVKYASTLRFSFDPRDTAAANFWNTEHASLVQAL